MSCSVFLSIATLHLWRQILCGRRVGYLVLAGLAIVLGVFAIAGSAASIPTVRQIRDGRILAANCIEALNYLDPETDNDWQSWALRENSWKSTPIEGVAGNLVIQQERPPNETVAKSPSIRLFSAFVCPPRLPDLRPPFTSGRGRFGHLLHLVDRSRANPWRKERYIPCIV
jgi:hypothetical protein